MYVHFFPNSGALGSWWRWIWWWSGGKWFCLVQGVEGRNQPRCSVALTLEEVGDFLGADAPGQAAQLDHRVHLDDSLLAHNMLEFLVAGTENWREKNDQPIQLG